MKKLNMIVSVVVMCILVMALPGQTVEAKGGSICMELEKGEADTSVEGVEFSYRKVADLVNGEIENVQFPKLITEERLQSAKGMSAGCFRVGTTNPGLGWNCAYRRFRKSVYTECVRWYVSAFDDRSKLHYERVDRFL